jgi:hypothetical protein
MHSHHALAEPSSGALYCQWGPPKPSALTCDTITILLPYHLDPPHRRPLARSRVPEQDIVLFTALDSKQYSNMNDGKQSPRGSAEKLGRLQPSHANHSYCHRLHSCKALADPKMTRHPKLKIGTFSLGLPRHMKLQTTSYFECEVCAGELAKPR